MYHLLLLALMPQADVGSPSWLQDYHQALKQGQTEQRPVLVILGSGENGYQKMGRDGGISKEANEVLAARYVCVYADITTAEGWKLARALGMTKGLGIVISDRTGQYQAFYHHGDLANASLVRYLQRYSDPNRVFVTTESNPGNEAACPHCSSCANGRCR